MSSKPDSSDKLEKRLPAGGQAVTGWGRRTLGAWGPAERRARLAPVQGSGGCRGPGASLADSHSGPGEDGAKGPQTVVLPGQGLKCMGRAGNLWCLSARLENGQLCRKMGRGWWSRRMEYPPLGACQLLGQEAPPCEGALLQTQVCGGGGYRESEGFLGLPELSWAGAGLLSQSPKRGPLQLGVGALCVIMRAPGGPGRNE